ncbi:hypothetical protein [Devosia sp.]|uniref:hypothetical protein n=1 Tax=Devosia sp. TaxID=1871048 RepID=UPI003A92A10A
MLHSIVRSAIIGASLLATAGAASAIETLNLGGSAKGDPSVVWYQFAGQDVVAAFVRGTDGFMYAQVGDSQGDNWTGWARIGNQAIASSPACTASGPHRIDCVAVGSGNNVFHVRYDAQAHSWSDWSNIGGYATGAPGITSTLEAGERMLSVFVSGPANSLFRKSLEAGSWTDWIDLDLTVTGDVACSDLMGSAAFCYDTGSGSAVQMGDLTHVSGSDVIVANLGGAIKGKASAAPAGGLSQMLHIFVRGPGNTLWVKTWDGAAFSNWRDLGAGLGSAPGCDAQVEFGDIWCASVKPNGTVEMILVSIDEL